MNHHQRHFLKTMISLVIKSLVMLSLRQHLLQGGKSYGPVCMSNSPIVMELLAMSGYGHMIIDHEHSPTDISSGQLLLQAMNAAQTATCPIIRVPDHNPTYMKKILDSMRLPGGVLVPMVEDRQTAEEVVAATRYPRQASFPSSADGIRGCAVPFIRASGYGSNPNYMKECQEDLLVMVQVETRKGVDAIAEISSVEGIDGIFLGPFDLSCTIGKVGQFDDPEVKALIAAAEEAVRQSDSCFLAGFRSAGRDLETMFQQDGYSLVCGSVDLGLLRDAAQKDAQVAKEIIDREGATKQC
jgi:4-hydroxy-2-oxoheptanedioate aldolase